ncbi:MAG: NAD(P)H-binding protein [Deltaproteobacteria bacterium]|nr:NAD(P)H-binding protein [Deltaproteobacteria bacterium]
MPITAAETAVRAFVAGASGYTGQAVVRVLRQLAIDTVAHVRPDSPRLDTHRKTFEILGAEVDTTPWDVDALAAAFARIGPTHLFCLIGTTRKRMKERARSGGDASEADYEAVDFGLTLMLANACAQADVAPRFVYLSAVGTNASSPGAYARARWKAEQAAIESGLPFTVARPAFITGSDRDEKRPLEHGFATVLDGALAVAGAFGAQKVRERYRSTNADKLARALVRVAFDPAFENRVVESEELR